MGNPASVVAMVDPVALAGVTIAAFAVAALRGSADDRRRAFAALVPLVRADPAADAAIALPVVRAIERVAAARSIALVDRVAARLPMLIRAATLLADCRDAARFREHVEDELASRARRHRGAYEFWAHVADAAPAMGLAGTVIGLIGMFAALGQPTAMAQGMALALATTLHGVVLAHGIALPIARRLERLSADELAWQRRALDHLTALADAQLAPAVRAIAPAPAPAPAPVPLRALA